MILAARGDSVPPLVNLARDVETFVDPLTGIVVN